MAQRKIKTSVDPANSQSVRVSTFFILSAVILLFVSVLIYAKSLNNELTQWDDDIYIVNNPDITTLKTNPLPTTKNAFTTFVNGNYHPVTMLSYTLEYYFFGLNTKVFHTDNLILHILNSFLVFSFIWLLTKKHWVAFITAILFAIHPMHVESVAWVSERKDLLYALFYLAALCTYVVYMQQPDNKKYYAITLILFVFSCLSKGMAVSLPLVLLLISYYKQRKLSKKIILETAPFFIISVVIGIVAIKAQASIGAINDLTDYSFIYRILFSCYALMMYLWKLFIPISNSSFYNYPEAVNGSYPSIIYVSPVILCIVVFAAYKLFSFLKNEFIFAALFFIITIALVLQLLPVGAAIIAERYTYLPYIGSFFLIATAFDYCWNNKPGLKNVLVLAFIAVTFALSYKSHKASLLWRDGVTLLENAAKNERFSISTSHYKNLAIAHFFRGNYDIAANYYTNAIQKAPHLTDLVCDRGIAYYKKGDYTRAIDDLSKVIQKDSLHMNARHYRGLCNFNSNNYKEAIADFSVAIALSPVFADHYYYRGLSQFIIGNYAAALADYNYMISKNWVSTDVYNNRGLVLLKMQRYNDAIPDFTKAIALNERNANAYFNKGLAYQNLLQFENALQEYNKAEQYNPGYGYIYFNRAQIFYRMQQYAPALDNALKARSLGIAVDDSFIKTLNR